MDVAVRERGGGVNYCANSRMWPPLNGCGVTATCFLCAHIS